MENSEPEVKKITIMKPSGGGSTKDLNDALTRLASEVLFDEKGNRRVMVVFDVSDLKVLSSIFLGLLGSYSSGKGFSGSIALCGYSGEIEKRVKSFGFLSEDSRLKLYPSVTRAIEDCLA